MPLEITLTPKLTYKLRLSPQMKLSLNLLQLPLIKLKEYLIEQVEKNPLLEPITNETTSPIRQLDDITNIEQEGNESSPCTQQGLDEQKRQYRESLITSPTTLREHLLRQLHLFTVLDNELKIGELIIDNIDDNGYLRCSLEDIAESSKTAESQVKKVLALIQTFDPIGVGARDLRECLLLQLKAKCQENSLAGQIIDKYLPFLEKKRYNYIAKKLSAKGARLPDGQGSACGGKVSVEKVKETMKEITNLEPKPGRSFSTERTLRLIPDAILKKDKDGYEVMLNDWELPSIRINDKYKKMISDKNVSIEVKEYLQERFTAAKALIGAIGKRRETIQQVIEEIIYLQKDCLDKEMGNFKPMTLSQIADRIGKHKSTVSRTIANKYLQTPYGIIELRQFLNSGVKQENGQSYSSKDIRFKISKWIDDEDRKKPLTDQDIANLFKQEGVSVSCRTITKYRTRLKILPSKSRRE